MGFFSGSKKGKKSNKEHGSSSNRKKEHNFDKYDDEEHHDMTCPRYGRGGGREGSMPHVLIAAAELSKRRYPRLSSVDVTYSKNVTYKFDKDDDEEEEEEACCEFCGCRCPCHGPSGYNKPCPEEYCNNNNNCIGRRINNNNYNMETPHNRVTGGYGDNNMYLEAPAPRPRQQEQYVTGGYEDNNMYLEGPGPIPRRQQQQQQQLQYRDYQGDNNAPIPRQRQQQQQLQYRDYQVPMLPPPARSYANQHYNGPPPTQQRVGGGGGELDPYERGIPNLDSAFSDDNVNACIVM